MLSRTALVVLGAASLVLDAACLTQTCTDAGCGIPVSLSIYAGEEVPLPDATYEVALDLDGSVYTTTCGLPAPGEDECEPFEGTGPFEVEASYTTNGRIVIFVGGYDPDPALPDRAELSVIVGDELVADVAWDITYEDLRPNGPDCGPVCRQASAPMNAFITEIPES